MKAVIDITSKCNLRCKHCYNNDKYFLNNINELSDTKILDLIVFLSKQNCDEINILGGEPLLRANIIDALKLAHNKNIRVSVTTNGLLINEPKYEEIFKENLIDNLIFSLDGQNKEQNDYIRGLGTFDKLMNNLEIVKNLRLKYNSKIFVSISHCVIENLINLNSHNIIDICNRYNIDSISFFSIVESGSALKNQKFLQRTYSKTHLYIDNLMKYADDNSIKVLFSIEERPIVAEYFNIKYKNISICPERHMKCSVLNNNIYIKADGTILPCGFVEFKSGFDEQRNGKYSELDAPNINNIKCINDIYSSKLYKDFIYNYNIYKNEQNNNICSSCIHKSKCEPCSYQNKNGEIFEECIDIIPSLNSIIEESKKWKLSKIFSNQELDIIFSSKSECTVEEGYDRVCSKYNFRHFINKIVLFENKGLIKITRKGIE